MCEDPTKSKFHLDDRRLHRCDDADRDAGKPRHEAASELADETPDRPRDGGIGPRRQPDESQLASEP